MKDTTEAGEFEQRIATPQGCSAYLNDQLQSAEPRRVITAAGHLIVAKGLGQVAHAAGIARAKLYRHYVEADEATLDSFLTILDALGMQLAVVPKENETIQR